MRLILGVLLSLMFATPVAAQSLPLEDGAYLRHPKWCPLYLQNELDFIDFKVGDDGRTFEFIEVGCLTYSVKKIRKSRYVVEADCTETGTGAYQRKMFLDVSSDSNSIRIDGGELHHFCKQADYPNKPLTKKEIDALRAKMYGIKPVTEKSVGTIASLKPIGMIGIWHEHNEDCRGGSGDDPNTEKSCNKRYDLGQKLNKLGWCFGKENQSGFEYKWHYCMTNSIR